MTSAEKYLRLTKTELYSLFLVPGFVADVDCIEENIKYCPYCLAQNRHYALFQFAFIHDCPLHRAPLNQRCRNCGASILNRLESATFKVPFGCSRCNEALIGRAPSKRVFARINEDGERLLGTFADILSRKANHAVAFSFQRQPSIYCDNVLSLSKSLEYAVAAERTFFDWLIRSASEGYQSLDLALYSKQVRGLRQFANEKVDLRDEDELTGYLFAIFKSLSRYLTRLLRAKTCLRAVCESLWWDPAGGEIPRACPKILALVAWRAFWLNARTPADMLQARHGNHRKIHDWLVSVLHDSSVLVFPPTQRLWLIQHIFLHALSTTFGAFLAAFAPQDDFHKPSEWPTNILSSSNCWAVYINNEGGFSITTFVPGPHKMVLSGLDSQLAPRICDCLRH